MGTPNQIPRPGQVGVLLLIGLSLAFGFNNCGKVASYPLDESQLAPLETKVELLAQKYQGKLTGNFCEAAENYACLQKTFSRELATEPAGSSMACATISGGIEICPQIQKRTYNSGVATELCKQEHCEESYEFEEFDCHLKLGANMGVYPVVVTGSELSEALETLHQSCLKIQQGSSL
jgi:hypothetical protein